MPSTTRESEVVLVEWYDTYVNVSESGGMWVQKQRGRPPAMRTVGFVVGKDKDYLDVAPTIAYDGSQLAPVSIPIGCIKRIRRMR